VNGKASRRQPVLLAVLTLAAFFLAVRGYAQFGQGGFGGRGFGSVSKATPADFDGSFQFCRAAFGRDPRADGGSWSVDYPRADINLSIRLSELTKTNVGRDVTGTPHHLLVELDDPELFDCPFVMMTNVGAASIPAGEALALRQYLLKGGFVWADDFWGSRSWDSWEEQLRRVLPAADFPIVDLPADHPLLHAQFELRGTPQIPNIGFWTRSGGGTSERGEDSAVVHTRAVIDSHGRIMVLMTHNTDLGDSFEREADDPRYFYEMSVPGYSFGINALLYAMTH
jgi:hypothetical protein